MADTANHDDDTKKALAYWGYLFKPNRRPADKLDRLLRGIAACISDNFEPMDAFDLRPVQLASFYRKVGGDYDALFTQMPAQSVAFVFKSLGCLHSLQPSAEEEKDGFSSPTVPALKPKGFVTWQTIQILLGPEEHVPFIQNALLEFDIMDPATGKAFPKLLPRECFPSKPDPEMVKWHEGVSERLRIEAQEASDKLAIATHEDEHPSAHDDASVASAEERADAAKYFSNPHYRNHDGRPAIVRSFTRAAPKVKQEVMQGGKAVALTVRNIANPYLWTTGSEKDKEPGRERPRRRSRDERVESHEFEGSDVTPLSHRPPNSRGSSYHHSHSNSHSHSTPLDHHRHPPPPRRRSRVRSPVFSSSDSEEDDSRRRRQPAARSHSAGRHVPRHHRSYEPASSPNEYFGHWDRARQSHTSHRSDRSQSRGDSRPRPIDPRRRHSGDRTYSNTSHPHHQRRHSGDRTFSNESSRSSRHRPARPAPETSGERDRDRDRDRDIQDRYAHHRRTSIPHIGHPISPDPDPNSPSTIPPPAAARAHPNMRSPQARPVSGVGSGTGVRFTDPFTSSNPAAEPPPRRSSTTAMPSPVPVPTYSTTTARDAAAAVAGSEESSASSSPQVLAQNTPLKAQSQSMPDPPVLPPPTSGDAGGAGKRPPAHRYVTPVGGVKGRRYPNEATWR